jgi:hypothetical protein
MGLTDAEIVRLLTSDGAQLNEWFTCDGGILRESAPGELSALIVENDDDAQSIVDFLTRSGRVRRQLPVSSPAVARPVED